MNQTTRKGPAAWLSVVASALSLLIPVYLFAQGGQAPPAGQAKGGARGAAPIDLTGYWVSLVTEDWLYRMVTPAKGDFASIPLNGAGRGAANTWDPAKDQAAGEQCKAYGAIGNMREPGRLHIEWQDENTIKIDFDAGTQTRLLHFGGTPPASGDAGYQGYSVATWDGLGRGGRGAPPPAVQNAGLPPGVAPPPDAGRGPAPPVRAGSLKVVTTHMKPGYLRKNGVPYSANAVLTEFFDKVTEPDGETLLIVVSTVDDPQFLAQPFLTSTHFKKEPDGAKWSPSACSAK